MSETRVVEYISQDNKTHKISYELIIKNVKNINLKIRPNLKVEVSANQRVDVLAIDEFVISKGNFILKALKEFESFETYDNDTLKFKTGEHFYFLGTPYPLLVLSSNENIAVILNGTFVIKVADVTNFPLKQKIVDVFIDENCAKYFVELSHKVFKQLSHYNIPYPKLKMQDMKSRWGSCNKYKQIINLNKRLIHSPIKSIEYVILHEFCHLVHPNHSKHFHSLVASIMPDWKVHKNNLVSF